MKELLLKLRGEVPYQWRVQSKTKDKSKAICTAYIDARQVMDILDEHCTWQSEFKDINGFIFCGIGIQNPDNGEWVWRWDCGQRIEEDKTDQMFEQAGKSAASDAAKRAGVQWGIGRFLYDLDTVMVQCDQYGNPVDSAGNRIWDLTTHINSMKSRKPVKVEEKTSNIPATNTNSGTSSSSSATSSRPASSSSAATTSDETQPLGAKQFDAMVKAIGEGKIEMVESALPKYKLSLAQKTTLTKLIKDAKGT
jgi:hypothetical protein